MQRQKVAAAHGGGGVQGMEAGGAGIREITMLPTTHQLFERAKDNGRVDAPNFSNNPRNNWHLQISNKRFIFATVNYFAAKICNLATSSRPYAANGLRLSKPQNGVFDCFIASNGLTVACDIFFEGNLNLW